MTTPILELPELSTSVGSKETTHNTALRYTEGAIGGVLSKSVAAGHVTLTNAEATRNMVFVCTGSPGAARNLIVPVNTKLYLVKNNVGDSSVVTVKTASGTGIAIPAGEERWVRSDGTNVVAAGAHSGGGVYAPIGSNYLVSGTGDSGLTNERALEALTSPLRFRAANGSETIDVIELQQVDGHTGDLLQLLNKFGDRIGGIKSLLLGGAYEVDLESVARVKNSQDAVDPGDLLPLGQAEDTFAPIGSAYLVNATGDATLTGETPIQALASALTFKRSSSAGGIIRVQAFDAAAESMEAFETLLAGGGLGMFIKPNGDIFTNGLLEVVGEALFSGGILLDSDIDGQGTQRCSDMADPASPQDYATKNYVDTGIVATLLFGANATNTSTTRFLFPGGSDSGTAVTIEAFLPVHSAGTISRLYAYAETGPTGANITLTVRKNGSDQTLVCTINDGANAANDTTHSFTVAAGDRISVKLTFSGTLSSQALRLFVSMKYSLA